MFRILTQEYQEMHRIEEKARARSGYFGPFLFVARSIARLRFRNGGLFLRQVFKSRLARLFYTFLFLCN